MVQNILSGQTCLPADNKCVQLFVGICNPDADAGGFKHPGTGIQDFIDFIGKYVESADKDHVFRAVDDSEIAIRINRPDIPGPHPAIDIGGSRFVRPAQVTGHQLRPSDDHFSDIAGLSELAVVEQNPDVCSRERQSGRTGTFAPIRWIDRQQCGRLGHPITFDDLG